MDKKEVMDSNRGQNGHKWHQNKHNVKFNSNAAQPHSQPYSSTCPLSRPGSFDSGQIHPDWAWTSTPTCEHPQKLVSEPSNSVPVLLPSAPWSSFCARAPCQPEAATRPALSRHWIHVRHVSQAYHHKPKMRPNCTVDRRKEKKKKEKKNKKKGRLKNERRGKSVGDCWVLRPKGREQNQERREEKCGRTSKK